jgi:hypothetical protein
MTKLLLQPGRVLGLLLLVTSAACSATITIVQSVGPTVDASGKLATYLSNAEFALQNNLTSFGTVNDPVNYAAASQPIYAGSIITTPTFASWLGAASPTGAYANENGNELYFGVSIFSSTPFTMSQILFSGGLITGGSLSHLCFNAHTVGMLGAVTVASTPDANCGVLGSTTADGLTPINQLWYSGIGLFDQVASPAGLAAELALISGTVGDVTYSLTAPNADGFPIVIASATSHFDLEAAPEPGTIALLSLGFGAMLCLRKKVFATRIR